MALENIVNVDITLNTVVVSKAGFGTPIFCASHSYFPERVRGYTSIAAAEDDIPTGTPTYKALTAIFSQQPSVEIAYVGRRDVDETIIKPSAVVIGKVYSFDLAAGTGTATTVTYTAVTGDTQEKIVDGWVTQLTTTPIAGVTATKVGTGANTTFKLVASGANPVVISNFVRVTDSYVTTETAPDLLTAIQNENDDWYFMMCDDHTTTFVLAMAEAIEAREKLYFMSSQEAGSLSVLADPATDTLGKVKQANYLRTVGIWHHQADTEFVECSFAGYNAPYNAGTVTWNLARLQGVSASADPVTGKRLTYTQKNNLASRNANFVDLIGGVVATREGKSLGGEWIDILRGRDWLKVEISTDLQNWLLNQKGKKVPYTQGGIDSAESLVQQALQRGVDRNFLSGYETNFPLRKDVSFSDVANRRLVGCKFVGYLAGAIHVIKVQGELTYGDQ